MNEGYPWVIGGKELSMVPRGGFEDASVGPKISQISSHIPWEGGMSSKKGEGGIVPVEEIVCWDFARKGSWWLKREMREG